MLLTLLIGGLSSAAPAGGSDEACRSRLSAQDFRAATDRAVAELAAGARPAMAELGRLVTQLPCVDGPLYEDDLGRLYLARGISLYSSDRERALDLLRWAAGVGADWLDGFGIGDNLYRVYTATQDVVSVVGVTGTLSVPSLGAADVLLIDGWVVGPGERAVVYGAHLVQWRDAEGWHAEHVVVDSGQTVTVGPPPAAVRPPAAPGPSWGTLYGGMRFYRGDIYDGYRRWDGAGLTPSALAEGHLGLRGAWGFDGGVRLGSGASGERPPMVTGIDARGSYRTGDQAWAALGLGLRGAVLPAVVPGLVEDAAPTFRESWRLGGAAALSAGASDGPVSVGLELAGAAYGVGWETWGGLSGSLDAGELEPAVRIGAGFVRVDAAWGRQSRYDWYSVEVGARWRAPVTGQ